MLANQLNMHWESVQIIFYMFLMLNSFETNLRLPTPLSKHIAFFWWDSRFYKDNINLWFPFNHLLQVNCGTIGIFWSVAEAKQLTLFFSDVSVYFDWSESLCFTNNMSLCIQIFFFHHIVQIFILVSELVQEYNYLHCDQYELSKRVEYRSNLHQYLSFRSCWFQFLKLSTWKLCWLWLNLISILSGSWSFP